MSITQLEYILAVNNTRNFRQAADHCHVTQPTLSTQVQKYEETIGAQIFDRSKHPIQPTLIGKQVIAQAKISVIEYYKINELVKNESKVEGVLNIGVIPTISSYLTPLFIKSISSNYPDLKLKFFELTTENCLLYLEDELIDVAILATPESKKLYRQINLFDEEMLLYVNPDNALFKKNNISLNSLDIKDLWLLEEGHCLRDEVLKICKIRKHNASRPKNIYFQLGSLQGLRYLVDDNFGYTLLPYITTLKLADKNQQQLKNFTEHPTRSINLTCRKHHLKNKQIIVLKNEILGNLPPSKSITFNSK